MPFFVKTEIIFSSISPFIEIKKIINKDTIVLLNKSDMLNKQNHKFDADTVLASVKENKNIPYLIDQHILEEDIKNVKS